MTRREMQHKIEDLENEVRLLRAKTEAGHCHGCHCNHVIYYPQLTMGTTTTYPITTTWTSSSTGGNYQITG